MKIASAEVVPWSSAVGSSVILRDANGKAICQLAVLAAPDRETAESVSAQVVDAFDDLARHRAVTDNLHILSTSNNR